MRALLQRVASAEVRVAGEAVASIGMGLVILVGVGHDDDEAGADALARRIVELRIFRDLAGRTNRSIIDVAGG
ncbi:MAG: D-aminoacyl-tRNA deacylase, partial [Chloroflexi bacterium]|nr:D-aminoacyl-tRNA deacylase [Chloroflexota bacterium]